MSLVSQSFCATLGAVMEAKAAMSMRRWGSVLKAISS
jgi:hypothetical protein